MCVCVCVCVCVYIYIVLSFTDCFVLQLFVCKNVLYIYEVHTISFQKFFVWPLWAINSGVLTSLLLPHLSSSLIDSLPSLNLLCLSKTHARFMQDAPKAVWSIPYVSVAFFPSLKQNFIAFRSSKVSYCIFEIHQLWQSGFSRVYSNCCCRCSFEPEIIKIGLSSRKMYSNNKTEFPRVYDF